MGDLNKMDTTDEDISDDPECHEVEDMLGIEPLDILLPMELKKPIIYSIELTNGTDDHFAFWISTTSLRPYNIDPIKDIVPPLSTRSVTITLQGLEKAPLHNQCKDEFNVKSTKVDCSLTVMDISEQLFDRVLNVVDKVNLTIVLDIPNGQPVMVHTRDQHDYHRMHTWRDIYADHFSG
ncbi:hypothetical protein QOZ80_9BG0701660 [Eleusine coracana subsp. coracana]|nr:hypothetical protein QOZ80_9BG0701660 [Eleusine coracana subsp. coracana]